MIKLDEVFGLANKYEKYGVNFVWRSLQMFGTSGITFLIFFIAARLLTPELFGQYNYLLALVSFFVIFGEFGLSSSVSKYVAEYNVKNKEKINSIIFSSITICFILSLIVSIFLLIFGKYFFAENYKYIIYLIPLVFLISSVNIFDGIYRGLQKFKKLSIISITSGVFALASTFFLISAYGIIGALLVQIFYYSVFLIFLLKFTEMHISFDKEIANKVFKYALIIGFAGLGYFLYTRIDILILEHFGYIVEIGYYEIINKIFTFLFLPFVLLGQVIAPSITGLMVNKKYEKIVRYTKGLVYFFLIGIGISIICYFLLPSIIKIILPGYFKENLVMILNVLLLVLPFRVMAVVLTHGFIMPTGFAKISTYLVLVGGCLNTILDFIFIGWYGFIGVFYVTVLVQSLTNILVFVWYYCSIKKRV